MVDVGAIGQEHISDGAPVLVETVRLERDLFPKGEFRGGLLGALAVSLAFFGTVDAVEADAFSLFVVENFYGVAVRDAHNLPRELNGGERRGNGGVTLLARRQHLGRRRKGSLGELSLVTVVAAVFPVMVATVGIESTTMGTRHAWRKDKDQEGEEK